MLAPAVVLTQILLLVGMKPLGIAPPPPVYVFDGVMVAIGAMLGIAIFRQRIADRHLYRAGAAMLACGTVAIAVSMYATNRQVYALLLIAQATSYAMVLDTRIAVGMIATVAALGITLSIRAGGPDTPVYVAVLVVASQGALVIHKTVRRSLVRTEQHRAEIAHQLEELKRLQEQLLHSQRMEAVGTLAAGLAHDMNNVLASIRNLGQLLLADRPHPDVDQIIAQTERGAALTRGLLAYSRRGQYRKAVVRLADVMSDVLPLLERTLPKSIEVRSELALGDACIEADATQLEQVLVNLALNAKDAMAGTGTLTIRGEVAATRAKILVIDTGCGMDDATRSRVFEPFFTTKKLGDGTGLGLSTVWGIVQSHGGSIAIDSRPGAGATFAIELPLTACRPAAAPIRKSADVIAVRGTVLVVDDEPAVRSTTARLLERHGLEVITAENGAVALQRFAERASDIRLVILDMGMPVMGGAECFRTLREHSDVPVLIATGYSDDAEAQSLVHAGAAILEKPFSSAQLKAEVLRLLACARVPSAA
jgi:signal transduction histidine kinase/CheY-like chemotaxis protein